MKHGRRSNGEREAIRGDSRFLGRLYPWFLQRGVHACVRAELHAAARVCIRAHACVHACLRACVRVVVAHVCAKRRQEEVKEEEEEERAVRASE